MAILSTDIAGFITHLVDSHAKESAGFIHQKFMTMISQSRLDGQTHILRIYHQVTDSHLVTRFTIVLWDPGTWIHLQLQSTVFTASTFTYTIMITVMAPIITAFTYTESLTTELIQVCRKIDIYDHFKTNILADILSSHRYLYNYGSSYMNSDYLKSEIYLAKGEQAYYKPYTIGGGNKYVNQYDGCRSVDDNNGHSCTWLEIRKTGDPIA